MLCFIFFFNDTATTEIYTYCHTLSLHDALPIWRGGLRRCAANPPYGATHSTHLVEQVQTADLHVALLGSFENDALEGQARERLGVVQFAQVDRKSTRLNSSH